MEAQTDVQTYLERGKQALAQGQGRDAAIAYAYAAQIEPDNPIVHLGLAEANLALGSYGVVYMACRKVQELQPQGGGESDMAKALLDLLDRRYERALQDLEVVINEDPGNAYAHAMRSYLLRVSGQSYDAGLARARAARLSFGGHFDNCFPSIEPVAPPAYSAPPVQPKVTDQAPPNGQIVEGSTTARSEQEPIPTWSQHSNMQRQVVRTRFWMSQHPRFVTNILIGINVAVYVLLVVLSMTIGAGLGQLGAIDTNIIVLAGGQLNSLVAQGQIWRIFTAMFLHFNLLHIGLNMFSLFLIGGVVEMVFGKWRYLLIYLGSGIVGGILTFYVSPINTLAAGASGAIFGVFGALGVFYIFNRQALGRYGTGAITNWLFWLGLNLVFGFSQPGIGIWDHIGGLVAGMIIAALLMPRTRRRVS
ncbi:MAG: rhomboid family intramembrane serine protease [Ktedonobacteraceae bacterium]